MKANPFAYFKNLLPKLNSLRHREPPPPPAHRQRPPHPAWTPAIEPPAPPSLQTIDVSFAAIVQILPPDLQARVCNRHVFEHVVLAIPTERILPQLASGDVNISFGELRMAVPDAFASEPDADFALVPLPLAEICHQIDPLLFEQEETGLVNRVPKSAEPSHRSASKMSLSRGVADAPVVGAPAKPAKVIAFAPPPRPSEPARVPAVAQEDAEPEPILARSAAVVPLASQPLVAEPPDSEALESEPLASQPLVSEPLVSEPLVPEPAEAEASVPDSGPDPLLVPFAEVTEGWPEPIQKEIRLLNLSGAQLALPMELTAKGLKQARLVYSWRALRHWIRPALPEAASASDQTALELPLKAVAPRFLARQRENTSSRRKVATDQEIPDLFFAGTPPPPPAAAAVPSLPLPARGSDRLVPDQSETQSQPIPPGGSAPHQLVRRAAGLKGVGGALIALTDGLLVASSFPKHINADTVAAFLPAVFSKLNQYTRELKMGDLNVIDFVVGKVPWKVIRVNDLFFACVGCDGQPLPAASLAALAAELRSRE